MHHFFLLLQKKIFRELMIMVIEKENPQDITMVIVKENPQAITEDIMQAIETDTMMLHHKL
jgi:hypothetical protein